MEMIFNKILETSRMTVRPLSESDIPYIYGLMSDYETAARTGFRPMGSSSEAEGFVRRGLRAGNVCGLSLKEKPDEIFGLILLSWDNTVSGDGSEFRTCTFGYFMSPEKRGYGYMPEAVDALKQYLFGEALADRLAIFLVPDNNPSRSVARKCGFTLDRVEKASGIDPCSGKIVDLEYYSLTSREYGRGSREECREVRDYRQAVVSGTCDDMLKMRGMAISKLMASCRPGQPNDALKAFLADKVFPGEIYRSGDWDDTVRKMRLLLSFGCSIEDAVWQVIHSFCTHQLKTAGMSAPGNVEKMLRWLCAEGADVNAVREHSTAFDILGCTAAELRHAESSSPGTIQKVIATVKDLGGRGVYDNENIE